MLFYAVAEHLSQCGVQRCRRALVAVRRSRRASWNGRGQCGFGEEIVQAFDEAQDATKRRMVEKEAKRQSASDSAWVKKREKIQAMVAKLQNELGAAAPWKDAVLAYRVMPLDGLLRGSARSSPPVEFASRLVGHLLADYVKAPSKATPKKVTELKETLLELFRVVMGDGETHFYDFSFLSQTDPMESALREHYCAKYPGHEHLTLLGTGTGCSYWAKANGSARWNSYTESSDYVRGWLCRDSGAQHRSHGGDWRRRR